MIENNLLTSKKEKMMTSSRSFRKIPQQLGKMMVIAITLMFMSVSSYSQDLPKGAKLETIDYSQINKYQQCTGQCYKIEGYVLKGALVNNQKISIGYNNSGFARNGTDIISGTYYTKDDGHSYIDGTCSVDGTNGKYYPSSPISGLFRVSNKMNGVGITVSKKEAAEISIFLVDITFYEKENTVLQKQPDGTYSYKVTFAKNELGWRNTMEVPISLSTIQNIGLSLSKYDFSQIILTSNQVKISYNDGSVFIGKVDRNYYPSNGICRFANGEIFEGDYKQIRWVISNARAEYLFYAPYKGKKTFVNGAIVEGNWLEKYDFNNEEFEQIVTSAKSLTEMRDNLVRISTEQQRKLQAENEYMEMLIEEVESVLDNDYYSDNCHSVEVLEELRGKLDKLEKELPMNISNMSEKTYLIELKSALSDAVSAQILTKKYGATTAKKIVAGKYEIGMSKEMVEEALRHQEIPILSFYKKSVSASSETWSIDWSLARAHGITSQSLALAGVDYPMLVFRNGKLTDIIR